MSDKRLTSRADTTLLVTLSDGEEDYETDVDIKINGRLIGWLRQEPRGIVLIRAVLTADDAREIGVSVEDGYIEIVE